MATNRLTPDTCVNKCRNIKFRALRAAIRATLARIRRRYVAIQRRLKIFKKNVQSLTFRGVGADMRA
jgi:hypothetical protein